MTDQPTNRPTDKAGCRVACTRLKKKKRKKKKNKERERQAQTTTHIPISDREAQTDRLTTLRSCTERKKDEERQIPKKTEKIHSKR